MFQKQPSVGVLIKRCSENILQVYRRTLRQKCNFNKVQSNFVEITLNCCIFLEHLFLRTPLDGCFCILSQCCFKISNKYTTVHYDQTFLSAYTSKKMLLNKSHHTKTIIYSVLFIYAKRTISTAKIFNIFQQITKNLKISCKFSKFALF